jgi:hypothetical protein
MDQFTRSLKLFYANCTKKFYNQILDQVFQNHTTDFTLPKKEAFSLLGPVKNSEACLT